MRALSTYFKGHNKTLPISNPDISPQNAPLSLIRSQEMART